MDDLHLSASVSDPHVIRDPPVRDLAQRVADLESARAHVLREIDVRDRFSERLRTSEERASDLALRNIDYRLEGMNEFRAQIKDTEGRYITRDEVRILTDKIGVETTGLREWADARFRALERLVYMGAGAAILVTAVIDWIRSR